MVTIAVGIYIVNLAAIDEVKETFELDGYLTETWHDNRLKYSPSSEAPTLFRTYHEDQVWYPLLSIMTYTGRFVVNLSTNFYVRRFPFDSQGLAIDIQPTLADRDIITLVSNQNLVQLSHASYVGMAQQDICRLSQRTTRELIDGAVDHFLKSNSRFWSPVGLGFTYGRFLYCCF
ncbi:MAG: hypothetical protein C5B58_06660 [Acidobacteria bacterium]|nr:MAG: hypothetical protein C5B58_06660 [Acidobacteriota bacterium]